MSQDQRPVRTRAVAVTGNAPLPSEPATDPAAATIAPAETGAPNRPSLSPIGAALFLIGCAGGGGLVAALPHLAPEFLAGLFGHG